MKQVGPRWQFRHDAMDFTSSYVHWVESEVVNCEDKVDTLERGVPMHVWRREDEGDEM